MQGNASENIEHDLKLIHDWSVRWKMVFNPDITDIHPQTFSDGIQIKSVNEHKHLGLVLDRKLSFTIDEKISIANREIGSIRKSYHYLPRKALIKIYKSFIRPHFDYCDIIYHKPIFDVFSNVYYTNRAMNDSVHLNEDFSGKLGGVQYRASLAISGCIKGTSREKLYAELGLESLNDRRLFHGFLLFYKILNDQAPTYLKQYIPERTTNTHNVRSHRGIHGSIPAH